MKRFQIITTKSIVIHLILVFIHRIGRTHEVELGLPVWAVIALAKYYGVSTDYLLGLSGRKYAKTQRTRGRRRGGRGYVFLRGKRSARGQFTSPARPRSTAAPWAFPCRGCPPAWPGRRPGSRNPRWRDTASPESGRGRRGRCSPRRSGSSPRY